METIKDIINSVEVQERLRSTISFKDAPSRTKSEFAEECNINNIVGRAMKTGVLPSGERKPLFDDFSEVKDYTETQRIIASAEQNFMMLDAETRNKFNNNVADLLDFIDNPDNAEEAANMGLIEAPIKDTPVSESPIIAENSAPEETTSDS